MAVGVWSRRSSSTATAAVVSGSDINVPAYFSVLALSVILSEIICKSPHDIRVCRSVQGRVFSNCAFIFARLLAIGYLIGLIVLQTAPLEQCSDAYQATSALYTLSITFSLFLIYDRLRSSSPSSINVPGWRRYILPAFSTLLGIAVVLGCALTLLIDAPFPGRLAAANTRPGSAYCTLTTAGAEQGSSVPPAPYAAAFIAGPLVVTALVFIFIASRQVDAYAHAFWSTPIIKTRQFVEDCAEIMKVGFVENGQIFYLVSTVMQLVTLILFLLGQSTQLKVAILPLNLAVLTTAAGRGYIHSQNRRMLDERARRRKVFRNLGFGSSESAVQVNASEESMGSLNRSMDGLGGIRVTKTVIKSCE